MDRAQSRRAAKARASARRSATWTPPAASGRARTQTAPRMAQMERLGETGRPVPDSHGPTVDVDADQLHAGRLAVSGRRKGGRSTLL